MHTENQQQSDGGRRMGLPNLMFTPLYVRPISSQLSSLSQPAEIKRQWALATGLNFNLLKEKYIISGHKGK